MTTAERLDDQDYRISYTQLQSTRGSTLENISS